MFQISKLLHPRVDVAHPATVLYAAILGDGPSHPLKELRPGWRPVDRVVIHALLRLVKFLRVRLVKQTRPRLFQRHGPTLNRSHLDAGAAVEGKGAIQSRALFQPPHVPLHELRLSLKVLLPLNPVQFVVNRIFKLNVAVELIVVAYDDVGVTLLKPVEDHQKKTHTE